MAVVAAIPPLRFLAAPPIRSALPRGPSVRGSRLWRRRAPVAQSTTLLAAGASGVTGRGERADEKDATRFRYNTACLNPL